MADELSLGVTAQGVTIPVRATPRAKRAQVLGFREGALRVAVTAPPVEGAANDAIGALLAEVLGVPRRQVSLLRGESARQKLWRVQGLSAEEVRARLVARVHAASGAVR